MAMNRERDDLQEPLLDGDGDVIVELQELQQPLPRNGDVELEQRLLEDASDDEAEPEQVVEVQRQLLDGERKDEPPAPPLPEYYAEQKCDKDFSPLFYSNGTGALSLIRDEMKKITEAPDDVIALEIRTFIDDGYLKPIDIYLTELQVNNDGECKGMDDKNRSYRSLFEFIAQKRATFLEKYKGKGMSDDVVQAVITCLDQIILHIKKYVQHGHPRLFGKANIEAQAAINNIKANVTANRISTVKKGLLGCYSLAAIPASLFCCLGVGCGHRGVGRRWPREFDTGAIHGRAGVVSLCAPIESCQNLTLDQQERERVNKEQYAPVAQMMTR